MQRPAISITDGTDEDDESEEDSSATLDSKGQPVKSKKVSAPIADLIR